MVTALEVFDSIQDSIRRINNQNQLKEKETKIFEQKIDKKNSLSEKTKFLIKTNKNKFNYLNFNSNDTFKNPIGSKSYSSNKSNQERSSLINTSSQNTNNDSNHSNSCQNSKNKVNNIVKLPLKINTSNKNNKLIPMTILTDLTHYLSTKNNKNHLGEIPISYKKNETGKYIKKNINKMKINNRGFSSKTTKTINGDGNSKHILKHPSFISKKINYSKDKKIVTMKSSSKENNQGNTILKKIPTMKKRQGNFYPQFINNNNLIIKNGIRPEKIINFNNTNIYNNLSYNHKNVIFNK